MIFRLNGSAFKKDKFNILVFGGSQGAAKLNRTIVDAWENIKDIGNKVQVYPSYRKNDFEKISEEYKNKNIPGKAFPYLKDIGCAYDAADMIIARSGAMTVSELKILGKPCVLIPFPYATDNHQEFNARALEKEGMAKVIVEKDLTPGGLAEIIKNYEKEFSGKKKEIRLPAILPQDILAAELDK